MDIKIDITNAALKTHEKLTSLPGVNYPPQDTPCNRRLKNQDGFLQKVTKIRNNLNISWRTSQLLPPTNPLELFHINYNLDLIHNINKNNFPISVLHASAVETIHEWYPEDEWMHVYTDGSQIDKNGPTGATLGLQGLNSRTVFILLIHSTV